MKIFITGGAGYIGYSLIEELVKQDEVEEIVIYDNLSRSNYSFFIGGKFSQENKLKFIEGDLLDSFKLNEALEGVDQVIHLAAKVSTPYSDRDAHAYDQINHWGTAHLASAIEEKGIKKVIFLSSASVYGTTEIPIDEFYNPNPKTFYGISKLSAEKEIKRLNTQTDLFIIRAANVYGFNPAMRIDAVVNKFMFRANYKGRITLDGDGSQFRSFIHVDKLSQIITQISQTSIKSGTYNIVEHNMTISNLVEQIKQLYPNLEVLSINHNMPLRSIQIKTPCKITETIQWQDKKFIDELKELKEQFNF